MPEPWPTIRPDSHLELIAENRVLEDQVTARAKPGNKDGEHRQKMAATELPRVHLTDGLLPSYGGRPH